jgi:hypothetical protein
LYFIIIPFTKGISGKACCGLKEIDTFPGGWLHFFVQMFLHRQRYAWFPFKPRKKAASRGRFNS